MPTGALYIEQPPPTHAHYATQQPTNMHDNVQDSMQQAQQKSQHIWPPNAGASPATGPGPAPANPQSANGSALAMSLATQLDAIKIQQNTLRDQIKQSDANLSAQHTVNN